MSTALLIIDVQRGLFDPEPRPYEADTVVERINALAAKARRRQRPVIFIQHEQASGTLEYGSDSWQLQRQLEPAPADYFTRKTTPDSFLRTDLQPLLDSLGIRRLVLCGYASEFCVDTTARRAAALGYAVQIAADAHTTHDKAHATAATIRAHENATLPQIASFGVPITAQPSTAIHFEE